MIGFSHQSPITTHQSPITNHPAPVPHPLLRALRVTNDKNLLSLHEFIEHEVTERTEGMEKVEIGTLIYANQR
ncbi:hypothetical protein Pla144_06250 [Bythopirellula polymerisocia]|uniref:Uncharacterized protein n=1 Tax=Bythopirellula polymerisocia TaxID=2528003 RepID=A0A5C6D0Z3_9BACT|nr:hypothetical protein Pla144_06250 [Bythopirellula polymerisocia]